MKVNRKVNCVISSPVDCYSGYSARSRDFVKALIQAHPTWNIYLLSQRWGNTRFGYLEDHEEYDLQSRIIPKLTSQPDVWIQITVPNEFQKIGKYNIGVTAGIETTLAHIDWIKGCNRMDLILVSSEHSKQVFQNSKFSVQESKNGREIEKVQLKTKIEVLFEGIDLEKYTGKPSSTFDLSEIKENFIFLVVGHWLQGSYGEDRKNLGFTIKSFLETFKNTKNPPALLLKTQQATSSILDREAILNKIDSIRRTVSHEGTLPSIYLLHGEISDSEINDLYNHPKIKAMVSHTKGEGFGRPLLEFSVTGKPIICSAWSGQLDFLSKDFNLLLGGTLTNVHPSAALKNTLLTEAKWFTPNAEEVGKAYIQVFKEYQKVSSLCKRQSHITKTKFSFEKMKELLSKLITENIPEFPEEVEIKLPEFPNFKKIK